MGANSHFRNKGLVRRCNILEQRVSCYDDDGLPLNKRIYLYEVYDVWSDLWLGTFSTYDEAVAFARNWKGM